jgi:hypothetical protein
MTNILAAISNVIGIIRSWCHHGPVLANGRISVRWDVRAEMEEISIAEILEIGSILKI